MGAHVYFGDWDEVKGQQLERELSAANQGTTTAPGSGSVHFQKLDVRDYASQLALFDTPFKAHGRVDVAVSCAAVTEVGGWFEPEALDLESVKKVSVGADLTLLRELDDWFPDFVRVNRHQSLIFMRGEGHIYSLKNLLLTCNITRNPFRSKQT